MRQHFLSLTADQERFNASPAVRRHHDEVAALLLGSYGAALCCSHP